MARKKKFKVSVTAVRNIVIAVFVVFVITVIYQQVHSYLTTAPLFAIKDITMDESILFVDSQDLKRLRGRNIFSVDLRGIQQSLRRQYPQIAELRIHRRFPDQLRVTAKERHAFAQILFKSAYYVIDKEGVVMRWSYIRDEELPSLEGMTLAGREMVMGAPVHGTDTKVGLQIIEACRDNRYLSDYKLTKVDLANLSKIIVYLDNEFQVILDREHIEHKLKMLGIVLSQHKIDFKEARYIDLRFNQPVVGRK